MKPIPEGFGQMSEDGSYVTICGVNYSVEVFNFLSNPNGLAYRFKRDGDVVSLEWVPYNDLENFGS